MPPAQLDTVYKIFYARGPMRTPKLSYGFKHFVEREMLLAANTLFLKNFLKKFREILSEIFSQKYPVTQMFLPAIVTFQFIPYC